MDRIDEITIGIQFKLEKAADIFEKCQKAIMHLRLKFSEPVESYSEKVQKHIHHIDEILHLLPTFFADVRRLQAFLDNEGHSLAELENCLKVVDDEIIPTVTNVEDLTKLILKPAGINLDDFE